MDVQAKYPRGSTILSEIQEFASFPKGTQRYIRRSLDLGLGRRDTLRRWARTMDEAQSIRDQAIVYKRIEVVREMIDHCDDLVPMQEVMAPLIAMSAYDLAQGRLGGFNPYRFLYERLIGAAVRPWLPSVFCAAAALPHLHPDARRKLLRSMDEAVATASGWSAREPSFLPEWVEKVDVQPA